MILVHTLSSITNPQLSFHTAKAFVDFWSFFDWNVQPSNEEIYVHPMLEYFSFIFGSNWVAETQEVKYVITVEN